MLIWFWWWDLCVEQLDEGLTAASDAYWQSEYERICKELDDTGT